MSASINEQLRTLYLSASDLKGLTNWPDTLIEDYLNLLENISLIGTIIDSPKNEIVIGGGGDRSWKLILVGSDLQIQVNKGGTVDVPNWTDAGVWRYTDY